MDKNHEEYKNYLISLSGQTQDKDLISAIFEILNAAQVKSLYDAIIKDRKFSLAQIGLNPYILAEKIDGIGFITADKLGLRLGIKNNDPNRIRFGILFSMKQVESNGDCACEERKLIMSTCQLLRVNDYDVKSHCINLCDSGELIYIPHNNLVFFQLKGIRDTELSIAQKLTELRGQHCIPLKVSPIHTNGLSRSQKEAINLVANSNIAIITGGPGTGKTHILERVLWICRSSELSVSLLAPTGKAARRVSEVTKFPATTIHKALAFDGSVFRDDIRSHVIIIDEFSMVDIKLFKSLLLRIKEVNPRIYLVGDADQLPSVGPGNLLDDLIESGFPVAKLTEIHRQAKKSQIIKGANDINHGVCPQDLGRELEVLRLSSAQHIADSMIEVVRELLLNQPIETEKGKSTKTNLEDVQVLSPMKKGVCGTIELNIRLQSLLNPNSHNQTKLGFYVGDRVMQTRNRYDLHIMNGSNGIIKSIKQKGDDYEIHILFDENKGKDYDSQDGLDPVTKLKGSDMADIILAYAITIHKSQGSEYPYIIMPVTSSHYMMLNRNLVYTGLTRAKKAAIMFIDDNGMTKAISTRRANRLTFLVDKIKTLSNN